uniref:Uncharacterized protein n=1 Tax=Cajanus cajan TaxID=3821 RepID=A0A151UB41_CAJCA|nr:hypothetical protein KK1_020712 [Cajanus cajan]
MASIFKLLSLILFFGFIFKGDALYCSSGKNIIIKQSRTGNWAHGMPEWKVRITNKCVCAQSQVKLKCDGFRTYKYVDQSILQISGDVCLLKKGQSIYPFQTVEFLYAWDPQFPFQLISSQEICDS